MSSPAHRLQFRCVANTLSLMALLVVAVPTVRAEEARAEERDAPLPAVKAVKTVRVQFDRPGMEDAVFDATPAGWSLIRAAMLPAEKDEDPAKWEGLGRIDVETRSGQSLRISLYQTGRGPGAFAVGKTVKTRVYYRGGTSAALRRALLKAHELATRRARVKGAEEG